MRKTTFVAEVTFKLELEADDLTDEEVQIMVRTMKRDVLNSAWQASEESAFDLVEVAVSHREVTQ